MYKSLKPLHLAFKRTLVKDFPSSSSCQHVFTCASFEINTPLIQRVIFKKKKIYSDFKAQDISVLKLIPQLLSLFFFRLAAFKTILNWDKQEPI